MIHMTDVKFFLFCDAAAVTQENKMVIHGTFDNLSAQQFPVVHPTMAVVFSIEGQEVVTGAELTFRLRNVKKEKDVIDSKLPLNLQITNFSFQGVLNIVASQFENPGLYQGILLLNGKQIAVTKLNVIELK